jgi:hypothetical protein
MSNFMKTRPAGGALFHADRKTDRQTDMTKAIVAYRNYAKGPKNYTRGSTVAAVTLGSLNSEYVSPVLILDEFINMNYTLYAPRLSVIIVSICCLTSSL